MAILNSIAAWVLKQRMHQIELFIKYPHDVQRDWLLKLMDTAKDTEYGQKYDFASIQDMDTYAERVPLNDYNSLRPYIDRMHKGERNVLWNSNIKWFAKSSGTTSDKSKFIPVSQESLQECHFKGGKDMYAIYMNNHPESSVFDGMNLAMGGSHHVCEINPNAYTGDLSAILIQNLPFWAEFLRVPNLEIALMNEWESKIDKMARATISYNVTNAAGVPSWTLLLFKHVLEITGKQNLLEVWPNFEAFFHGGISFTPYKKQFQELLPSDSVNYVETYNATEGFFGIQDQTHSNEMLLMLDYGIYYEFVPMDQIHEEHPKTLRLDEVELNKNYAIVISTNSGLWRYMIGDTVVFTSLSPYRIKISGRTRSFINAFGEELIEDNAQQALASACAKTHAEISEYTAAPVFLEDGKNACHEWLIEFRKVPDDLAYFTEVLDNALKSCNSDYEAKRYHNLMLKEPLVRSLPKGTFYNWMKSKGKLGGQHKVPRLANDRKIIEEILKNHFN